MPVYRRTEGRDTPKKLPKQGKTGGEGARKDRVLTHRAQKVLIRESLMKGAKKQNRWHPCGPAAQSKTTEEGGSSCDSITDHVEPSTGFYF